MQHLTHPGGSPHPILSLPLSHSLTLFPFLQSVPLCMRMSLTGRWEWDSSILFNSIKQLVCLSSPQIIICSWWEELFSMNGTWRRRVTLSFSEGVFVRVCVSSLESVKLNYLHVTSSAGHTWTGVRHGSLSLSRGRRHISRHRADCFFNFFHQPRERRSFRLTPAGDGLGGGVRSRLPPCADPTVGHSETCQPPLQHLILMNPARIWMRQTDVSLQQIAIPHISQVNKMDLLLCGFSQKCSCGFSVFGGLSRDFCFCHQELKEIDREGKKCAQERQWGKHRGRRVDVMAAACFLFPSSTLSKAIISMHESSVPRRSWEGSHPAGSYLVSWMKHS